MIRCQTIYRDPSIHLVRSDHPGEPPHRDPARETSSSHAVSFIEQGAFDLHFGRRCWRMDRAMVFVTQPGLSYHCGHVETPDDVSLSVYYSPELVEDLQSTTGRLWK